MNYLGQNRSSGAENKRNSFGLNNDSAPMERFSRDIYANNSPVGVSMLKASQALVFSRFFWPVVAPRKVLLPQRSVAPSIILLKTSRNRSRTDRGSAFTPFMTRLSHS